MRIQDDIIKKILKTTTVSRDALPYTEVFESLYEQFKIETDQSISRHNVWLEILRVCKKGGQKGKVHGISPPIISNPQQTLLWDVVKKISDCDNLPYSTDFISLYDTFKKRAGFELSKHEFWRLVSNHRKGIIRDEMNLHLEKSKESACLAVEVYNKPLVKFRSAAYIVLMNIAWTSLFHAIFFKRGVKPFYKDDSAEYIIIDGDKKAWELGECLEEYYGGICSPIRNNLEFFIGLRNKIEHRSMPELDMNIFGQCQAMLFNFETMLSQEFGLGNSINDNLALALQFSHSSWKEQSEAIKRLHRPLVKNVQEYINKFQSCLSEDVLSSLEYSYKFFLIPKVCNQNSSDSIAVEFIKYDPSNPEKMKDYEHLVAMIKPKMVSVQNANDLTAGAVCRVILPRLKELYGEKTKFSASSHHVRAWKFYKIRPAKKSKDPTVTDTRYCHYDMPHKDYVYTEKWVNYLLEEFSNAEKFKEVIIYKGS